MNQHYVPRVYLKHFSNKKGKEYFVDVFEKKSKRRFNTNIKNICAEKDLYTLNKDSKLHPDLLVFEKIYAEWIEPLYDQSYQILTNDKTFRISTNQRLEILTSVLQLYFRNPHILSDGLDKIRIDVKNLFASRKNHDGFSYLSKTFKYKDWTEQTVVDFFVKDLTKEYKEKHLLETQKLIEFHRNAKIEVQKIIDDGAFITSDNPLSLEDIVTQNRNTLLKTKEFTLPLNHKYAVKIYHDKTKDLNKIYRLGIPHGNASSINSNLDQQCIRFIIGSEASFDQYFYLSKFLNNSSPDFIIGALRQVIEKFPITRETADMHNVLKFYVGKYDEKGTLSKKELYEMHLIMRQLSIEAKKGKI